MTDVVLIGPPVQLPKELRGKVPEAIPKANSEVKPCESCGTDLWVGPEQTKQAGKAIERGQGVHYACMICVARAGVDTGRVLSAGTEGHTYPGLAVPCDEQS